MILVPLCSCLCIWRSSHLFSVFMDCFRQGKLHQWGWPTFWVDLLVESVGGLAGWVHKRAPYQWPWWLLRSSSCADSYSVLWRVQQKQTSWVVPRKTEVVKHSLYFLFPLEICRPKNHTGLDTDDAGKINLLLTFFFNAFFLFCMHAITYHLDSGTLTKVFSSMDDCKIMFLWEVRAGISHSALLLIPLDPFLINIRELKTIKLKFFQLL